MSAVNHMTFNDWDAYLSVLNLNLGAKYKVFLKQKKCQRHILMLHISW